MIQCSILADSLREAQHLAQPVGLHVTFIRFKVMVIVLPFKTPF